VVISGAGDRRDQDIRQQTEILGDAFDEVILYEDQCQRGRQDGEVVALLRQGLANARKTTQVSEIKGEFLAIDTAMDKLTSGDLCLILVDQVEAALAYIAARVYKRLGPSALRIVGPRPIRAATAWAGCSGHRANQPLPARSAYPHPSVRAR
jgi:hypothetical protein